MRREVIGIPLANLAIREASKRHRDGNKVARLAGNIKSTGQLNALIVRRIPGEDRYEILAGAMRALALQAAGKSHAECVVIGEELSEADILKLIVSENLQRYDPDIMEFSRNVCRYMEASGLNGTETAHALGISITEVSRCRERVQNWPAELQQLAEDERIAPSTAHAIHKIEVPEKKQEAMRLAAEGKLTRDAAFYRAQETKNGRPPAEKPKSSRIKIPLEGGTVTIAGPDLAPETVMDLLTELLKRARKAMSRGASGDEFLAALRESSPKKQGALA
jgi:ParB family chromosome partitioning protein